MVEDVTYCSFCGSADVSENTCQECSSTRLKQIKEREMYIIRKKRREAQALNCYLRCLSCEWSSNAGTKMICFRHECPYQHKAK